MSDTWQPETYRRFAAERRQPFDDLVAMLDPAPGGAVVDLGCGPGELTAELHAALGAASTLGLDNSDAMLAKAPTDVPGVRFEKADISELGGPARYDVVFSNAALQWLDDHDRVLEGWAAMLRPGGQLAVQLPDNVTHPAYVLAREVFGPAEMAWPVQVPEWYASKLHALGFTDLDVHLQVYPHLMDDAGQTVEWVKGSLLTPYRASFSAEEYEARLATYTQRVADLLGDARPYLFTFRRILFRGRLAG